MSWASIANNQTVSYGNLQDAVDTGVFTLISSIPSPSNRQSTKAVINSTVSGFNPDYPPYAAKTSNQLVVKEDIYNTGTVTLSPQYGIYFQSISGSGTGFPTFSYPVNYLQVVPYTNTISAQYLSIYLNGTGFTSPLSLSVYVNSALISCQSIATSGFQALSVLLPNAIDAPSSLFIAIDSGNCPPPPHSFSGQPISALAISRTTGQYQLVGQAYSNPYVNTGLTNGYLYVSNDYGATFTQRSIIGYWMTVSISDDGQYMLAAERYGNVYVSTDYGTVWTLISSSLVAYPLWRSSAISNNGTYMWLCTGAIIGGSPTGNNYYVLKSTNQGSTWEPWATIPEPNYGSYGLAVSSTGQYLQVGGISGLYSSNNFGAGIQGGFGGGNTWLILSASSSANGLIACATGSTISSGQETPAYLKGTTDGLNWFSITGGTTGVQYWYQVAINNSGTGYAIKRDNAALTYLQKVTTLSSVSQITTPGQNTWLSVAISGNGTYILAGAINGLWSSNDGGATFNQL